MSSQASYKQQKEDFVSNLSGGSVGEIAIIAAVGYVSRRDCLYSGKTPLFLTINFAT